MWTNAWVSNWEDRRPNKPHLATLVVRGRESRMWCLRGFYTAYSSWITLRFCALIINELWGYSTDSHACKGDRTENQAISWKALFYIKIRLVTGRQERKKEQNRTHGNPAAVYNCDKLDSVGNLGGKNPNASQAGSVGAHLHFVEGMDVLFFFSGLKTLITGTCK